MTDKEIEKGLECCAEFVCGECPYQKFDHIDYKFRCVHMLIVDVANLYKRTTTDAVRVVKCKDCKYLFTGHGKYCCCLIGGLAQIDENTFCSYGEKRK